MKTQTQTKRVQVVPLVPPYTTASMLHTQTHTPLVQYVIQTPESVVLPYRCDVNIGRQVDQVSVDLIYVIAGIHIMNYE